MALPPLDTPWQLAHLTVPNRVLLAPLAGIGNWCVRLQAKRYGAGMAVSEMVSSFAIHYGNEKTCGEMLRLHPEERESGPVAIQLFGQDPEVMRSAAAHVAATTDADLIDLNMGCPVPKVAKTGAGVAMLKDPDTAVAVARAAAEGSGLPVTVKLRSGLVKGDTTSGFDLAHRLVEEAGVAAIGFHPRTAQVHHKGTPDYALVARLVESLPAPVILTGGLHTAQDVHAAYEQTGAAAVMLARGALGNPWLFAEVLGLRSEAPTQAEILEELDWIMDRTVEHLGPVRGARVLRKFYPWYVERLGGDKALQSALQQTDDIAAARAVLAARLPSALA
ncbi:MAG: tRNA-dihydrouridine synthase [Solirubrobacterales bacterium]|nr:tRNA-dihydrouridine synthase [Solirubrobacterales bacterium]